MNSKLTELGKEGENLAAIFLKNKGYRILHQNYRYKYCEVDIIAEFRNCIIFVEVKRRKSRSFGWPEQFVNSAKKNNIIKAANHYMSQIQDLKPSQFDILSIYWPEHLREPDIRHFEDAFY